METQINKNEKLNEKRKTSTMERNRLIVEHWLRGTPYATIARTFSVSKTTVTVVVRDAGEFTPAVVFQRRVLKWLQAKHARDMRNKAAPDACGLTVSDCLDHSNVGRSAMRNVLVKLVDRGLAQRVESPSETRYVWVDVWSTK